MGASHVHDSAVWYLILFRHLLRSSFCLISHLIIEVPAAKTGLLGGLGPIVALCHVHDSSGQQDGLTAVEYQLCAKSGARDAGDRLLP